MLELRKLPFASGMVVLPTFALKTTARKNLKCWATRPAATRTASSQQLVGYHVRADSRRPSLRWPAPQPNERA